MAQRCEVSEGINPLNDSLCWIVGAKDQGQFRGEFEVKFIINKNKSEKELIKIAIISSVGLSSTVGDSASITLTDGYKIYLVNSKNFRSEADKITALFAQIDYYYVNFLSEISSKDIAKIANSKIKSFSLKLRSGSSLNSKLIMEIKKHPLISKTSSYTQTNDCVLVTVNEIYSKRQKEILEIALCANKYVQ